MIGGRRAFGIHVGKTQQHGRQPGMLAFLEPIFLAKNPASGVFDSNWQAKAGIWSLIFEAVDQFAGFALCWQCSGTMQSHF